MMSQFSEKWHREDLVNHIDEFYHLYENRPIRDNGGGMKSAHMFPSWYIIKKMAPKILIESGAWKGLGTWFFEQASPHTQIISIDPAPHFRIYTSPTAIYQTKDFLQTDWSSISKQDTLIFFDDHQNCLPRIKSCQRLGFKHIIVEDNYPYQQGDCYSPKKILSSGENFVIDQAGERTWHLKNKKDLEFFEKNIKIYQEMPPIFKDIKTRWGDDWNEDNYPTPLPLLNNDNKDEYRTFYSERFDYTWICYIELKENE